MNLKVYFEEVENYVENHYKIRPQLKHIDDKTLGASCRLGRFIPPVEFQLHIEAVSKDAVCLSYECGTSVAMLIYGAVEHLSSKLPQGVEINTKDKKITIFPNQVKGIRQVMEHAQSVDIQIHADGLELSVGLV